MSGFGSPKCPVCGKSVYPVEMANFNNLSYHKSCLRCSEPTCKKQLSTTQCMLHEGKIYCMAHYRKLNSGSSAAPKTLAQKVQSDSKVAAAAAAPRPASGAAKTTTGKPVPRGLNISPDMQKKMFAPSTGSLSQRVFQKYDQDQDGSITVADLKKMCMEMGALLTDDELAMAVKVMDVDGNGTIELDEFEVWWRKENRWEKLHKTEAEMAFLNGAFASFVSFDTDGNGTLDRQEFSNLHAVISQGGYPTHDEETDWLDMDRDGSGTISFNEYVEWLFLKAAEAANPRTEGRPELNQAIKDRQAQ